MTAATTAATALVIVESHFGNTRTIARAVAAGLADAGVRASVLDADRAGAPPADLDLLVVGAPTHNRGLPTAGSRAAARRQGATAPAGAIAKTLRRAGRGEPAVRSFVVDSSRGPLADGEEEAARAWGREWAGAQSAQTGQAGPGAGR